MQTKTKTRLESGAEGVRCHVPLNMFQVAMSCLCAVSKQFMLATNFKPNVFLCFCSEGSSNKLFVAIDSQSPLSHELIVFSLPWKVSGT